MSTILHAGEDVSVTEFFGGSERGVCVQIGTRQGFVQLDARQAAEVARALLRPRAGNRLTTHQLWRERAIWLLDALMDATREHRERGELDAILAHLDKHPSLADGVGGTDGR